MNACLPLPLLLAVAACATSSSGGGAPRRLTGTADMALVPAGTFAMGHESGEDDERPRHDVTLAAFRLDRREVTNRDYDACVDAGVCGGANSGSERGLDGAKQPVVGVTWTNADRYCQWVGKRLPTEAEWEHAARGSGERLYAFAGKPDPSLANLKGPADGFTLTAPVGSFPNGATAGTGIQDLVGNAAEWVADWYDPGYYKSATTWTNPTGPAYTEEKVVRGGSYLDVDYDARSTARRKLNVNQSSNAVGFRCAAAP